MKVLIATKIMHRISGEVLLQLDFEGYRVNISESEIVSQAVHRPLLSRNVPNMEDNESNYEVPGFEDLEGIKGMEGSNKSHSTPGKEDEEAEKLGDISNSNSNALGDKIIKDDGQKEVMGSRTITASFSQNGYSEELFKISQHLKKGAAGMSHSQEDSEVQAPPDFESIIGNKDKEMTVNSSKNQGQVIGLVGGLNNQSRKSQDTATSPGKHLHIPEKQLNQGSQQVQQVKTARKKKQASNVHHSSTESEGTTDSMIKLAEESLQVGELLGVRLVGNKKAAISRITDHLKKRKAQGKITQKQQQL